VGVGAKGIIKGTMNGPVSVRPARGGMASAGECHAERMSAVPCNGSKGSSPGVFQARRR